jgi:hypothetical protein
VPKQQKTGAEIAAERSVGHALAMRLGFKHYLQHHDINRIKWNHRAEGPIWRHFAKFASFRGMRLAGRRRHLPVECPDFALFAALFPVRTPIPKNASLR